MAIGIRGYGAAVPRLRIRVEEIQAVWRNTTLEVLKGGLQLTERCVLRPDEDTLTLAAKAGTRALERLGLTGGEIGAFYFGTYTNPWDSRPSCTTLAEMLGLPRRLFAADVQFAGKSGTSAMQAGFAMIKATMVENALVIASDTVNRHVPPGDNYEYTASAGAAAFLLGTEGVIATIDHTASVARELSDFFRLEGERWIRCGSGLGGDVFQLGLGQDSEAAARALFDAAGTTERDYDYVVLQQPYGNTPYAVGKRLGFERERIAPGAVADRIGDCGSASTLLGLAQVLDQARAGQRVLLVAYGFGAGADALSLTVTREIKDWQERPGRSVQDLIQDKRYVDYALANKFEYKYVRPEFPLAPNF